jgi:hypothetical protein
VGTKFRDKEQAGMRKTEAQSCKDVFMQPVRTRPSWIARLSGDISFI